MYGDIRVASGLLDRVGGRVARHWWVLVLVVGLLFSLKYLVVLVKDGLVGEHDNGMIEHVCMV